MTAIPSASNGTRAAQGALLLLLAMITLTAAWVTLSTFSGQFLDVSRAVARPAIAAAILYGLWLGLSRTDLASATRIRTWWAIAVPYTLWLATVWTLAVEGAFVARPGVPVIPIAIFLPLLVFLPLLLSSARIGMILDATPPAWLVGLQLYRVLGGVFLVTWLEGRLASAFALPAGIGDVTVGLLALPTAYYLAAGGRGGRGAAIAWNILGLLDFAIAISIGILSAPGPLQLIVPARPSIGAGTYPLVLIPTFAVPSSILLHALSLRQLRRLGRRRRSYSAAASVAVAGAAAGVPDAAQ